MTQTIHLPGKIIEFQFNENADCWQCNTTIDNLDITIEIDHLYHTERVIDWEHFKDFILLIDQNSRFKKIIADSQNLIAELGKAVFRNCPTDWQMEFAYSIFYNGSMTGHFSRNGASWSLIFDYGTTLQNGNTNGDDYALYLVDMENLMIIGARRC